MKKRMIGIAAALALALAGCVGMQVGVEADHGFVSLAEAVPDAILEIRYYSTYNFVGERVDGYERPCALITKEAAAALKAASDDCVRRGYRLKIYDAYRPQRAVSHFMRWAKDVKDTRMKYAFYPNLDKSVLFAQGYIAERSGHSRGSTVDLTLFDHEGAVRQPHAPARDHARPRLQAARRGMVALHARERAVSRHLFRLPRAVNRWRGGHGKW